MNHQFVGSTEYCKICNRDAADHSDHAECEICGKEASCNIYKTMLMCNECEQKEQILEAERIKGSMERVAQLRKDDKLSKREEYFNAERATIESIQGDGNTEEERLRDKIRKLEARNEQWAILLFEVQVKQAVNFAYIQELSSQLRKDERDKLREKYANYNPSQISQAKPEKKKRMSAEDKSILQMAQVIYGKKMALGNNIAKEIFAEHPEYYSNGYPTKEHEGTVNAIIMQRGGLTEQMAIELVKQTIRQSKNIQFQQIANGERKVSE